MELQEYEYKLPTPEEIDMYERLMQFAIPCRRQQAQSIARYDVGAAARYLEVVSSSKKYYSYQIR